jgi:hypothetical protein
LSAAPGEVKQLISALENGKVNGSVYSDGECGCLVGTLAMAAGAPRNCNSACSRVRGLEGDGRRPAERFFYCIKPGHRPSNSFHARQARDWAREWLSTMESAFKPRPVVSAPAHREIEFRISPFLGGHLISCSN